MERNTEQKIEEYLNLDFYENQTQNNKSPFSMIMDISDIKPGEIEIEDEVNQRYLWFKHYKKYK